MVALFHAFLWASPAKGAASRQLPTCKGLVGPSGRLTSLGPFLPKTPSGDDFVVFGRGFGVNLSKLVNWLHSRVFGHFQKMGFFGKSQKPRLASVLLILAKRPLHLTTFDQKPRSRKCRSATVSRGAYAPRPKKPEFLAKNPTGDGPSGRGAFGAFKVSERRGFWGKFFVKFWANFCTLPCEKIFRARPRKNSPAARDFRAKISRISRENFAKNFREKSRGAR